MTWLMPVQLLPFAGLLALAFAWPRISKPTSHVRLFVEVLIIAVGTRATWEACWWIAQRWWTLRVPEPNAPSFPGMTLRVPPAPLRTLASIRR
jgi:hypothetical protein